MRNQKVRPVNAIKGGDIRPAKKFGSRCTSDVPLSDVQKVLRELEAEAVMRPGVRKKHMQALFPKPDKSYERGYRQRAWVRMVTGSYRLLLLIAFPLYTGFRRSDCVRLKWSDLVMFNRDQVATVRPTVTLVETKTKKKRTVPIGAELAYYIMKYWVESKTKYLDLYVFVSRCKSTQNHLTETGMGAMIRDAFARFGIYDNDGYVAPHSLRKTYCNAYYEAAGGDFKALMRLSKNLGHSSVETTMRYMKIDFNENIAIHEQISFRPPSPGAGNSAGRV